jgi:hypothetical protein
MIPLAYKGKVVGNSVVLEEGAELPDGATVEVRLVPDRVSPITDDERQRALQRLLSLNLPVDDWEKIEDEIARGATEAYYPQCGAGPGEVRYNGE